MESGGIEEMPIAILILTVILGFWKLITPLIDRWIEGDKFIKYYRQQVTA